MALAGQMLQEPAKQEIKTLLATGATLDHTAQVIGCNPATVSRYKAKFREEIEALSIAHFRRNLPNVMQVETATLDLARDLHSEQQAAKATGDKETIKEARGVLRDNAEVLKLADKIGDRMQRSMGIAPSISPALIVQNVFNGPVTNVLNPLVAAALGKAIQLPDATGGDTVDADYEELASAFSDLGD